MPERQEPIASSWAEQTEQLNSANLEFVENLANNPNGTFEKIQTVIAQRVFDINYMVLNGSDVDLPTFTRNLQDRQLYFLRRIREPGSYKKITMTTTEFQVVYDDGIVEEEVNVGHVIDPPSGPEGRAIVAAHENGFDKDELVTFIHEAYKRGKMRDSGILPDLSYDLSEIEA